MAELLIINTENNRLTKQGRLPLQYLQTYLRMGSIRQSCSILISVHGSAGASSENYIHVTTMENAVTVHTFQNTNVLCNQYFIDMQCTKKQTNKKKQTIWQGKALISLFPVGLCQHSERCGWNADVAGSAEVRVDCLSLLLEGEDGAFVVLT